MKQFAVIGLGRFGSAVAAALYDAGCDVLAIDSKEELVAQIQNRVTHAVCADATNEDAMRALELHHFDVVVVAIGESIQDSTLVCLIAKEMGVKKVVCKVNSDIHARVLKKIGVDAAIFPERDMGVRLATSLISGNILDVIDLSDAYRIAEMAPLPGWVGNTLQQLDIRARFGVNVVAVKHPQGIHINPHGSYCIQKEDTLIMIGQNDDLNHIARQHAQTEKRWR